MSGKTPPRTIEWIGELDGRVAMIDQTRLPSELVILECRDTETIANAIKDLRVRGAPAIGIAGAMGVVLGVRDFEGSDRDAFLAHLDRVCDYLATTRPTAVNLSWALNRIRERARSAESADVSVPKLALLEEAKRIRDEDAKMCRAIGRHGEPLIKSGSGVLTHCNAGWLATAEYGTALAPLYTAHQRGRAFRVYATETRPLLQGSRLTVWELQQAGLDVTLICDNMAGALMQEGRVDLVITGADRIAANGDVANKIGTYGLAVLARAHEIPFYVAAPTSTFDLSIQEGSHIPIEQRAPDEIRCGFGRVTAPEDAPCYCPAFDITPAGLIRSIVTDLGIIQPVGRKTIAEMVAPGP
jgi:methylthioribose-1-phosphate isomerase